MGDIKSLLTRFQDTNFENESESETAVNILMCSLINDYVLKVNDDLYNFCEIELYYKTSKHNDCRVLSRENKQAGDIFFHRFGFDICFASNNDEYGGILVRSLKKDDEYILGPLTCSHTLLNRYQPNIQISIEKKEYEDHSICKTVRIKSPCKKNNYNESLYRYITIQAQKKIAEKNEKC